MATTDRSKGGKARAAKLTPERRAEIASRAAKARWSNPEKASGAQLRGVARQIEKHKNAIAKHRDALRELYDDLESILESSDRAVESLEEAIETLSHYL